MHTLKLQIRKSSPGNPSYRLSTALYPYKNTAKLNSPGIYYNTLHKSGSKINKLTSPEITKLTGGVPLIGYR